MTTSTRKPVPRAVIHKQILDAAANSPDASVASLADDVAGASVGLVERVLEKYGDPIASEEENEDENSSSEHMSDESINEPDELSDKQRIVLDAICERPDATQAELAEQIGVSASTINRRLNKIDEFDWENRVELARELQATAADGPDTTIASGGGAGIKDAVSKGNVTGVNSPDNSSNSDSEVAEIKITSDGGSEANGADVTSNSASEAANLKMEATSIIRRLDRIENQLDDSADTHNSDIIFEDTRLAAKVIQACTDSDSITDQEEVEIIQTLLRSTRP
jgi:transcriptional regulator with XRE-family HTH domain